MKGALVESTPSCPSFLVESTPSCPSESFEKAEIVPLAWDSARSQARAIRTRGDWLQLGPGPPELVRSGQVRSGQVRSGQVRFTRPNFEVDHKSTTAVASRTIKE